MRAMRTGLVALLIVGLARPAFAGDLHQSIARQQQQPQQEEERAPRGMSKPLVWTGAALFVGRMTVGLFRNS